MKCNWCGRGEGKNYVKTKEGRYFYYYCQSCLGQINIELTSEREMDLIREFLDDLNDLWKFPNDEATFKGTIKKWEEKLKK
jgi:hypothetical protein